MVRSHLYIFFFLVLSFSPAAQLKFLLEDFEGLSGKRSELKENGIFEFGCINTSVGSEMCNGKTYSGSRAVKTEKKGKEDFGGWGKGVGRTIELDQRTDYFSFYLHKSGGPLELKIELQEDDNADNSFSNDHDDLWQCVVKTQNVNGWQLVSVPLSRFYDSNNGGDGKFNISYHHGRLMSVIIVFTQAASIPDGEVYYFDFLCFSNGSLPTGNDMFDAPPPASNGPCSLGAWSPEGNLANYRDIGKGFEENFSKLKDGSGKKLGVVHFFQPFSTGDDNSKYHYPSAERINQVIDAGYIPMITLEDHFAKTKPGEKQPNLYSIVDGHFDSFFGYWTKQIKQVKGMVLLRILHEFNGEWYPWSVAKNDKDPNLPAKAFRYIHNIFMENNVTNVKFIWCPNSMSVPQESWNYIMDAYPGDEYVDFVALDIYNGAGEGEGVDIWRSFRKEGIENYYILTHFLPHKPLLVCETASRERRVGEEGQDKAGWTREMAVALKTDMSEIRLLTWFNEKKSFKVESSKQSLEAFNKFILGDPHFYDGRQLMDGMIGRTMRK